MLRILRDETDTIGVGVSFGKDSLAVLDLCCRIFEPSRIHGYYLFRVRGLSIVDEWSEDVRRRTGVVVRMYPHFDLSRCYKHHVLQPHWKLSIPKISMADIENSFRKETGVDWLAYGWRRNDSYSRTMIMKQTGGVDFKSRRVFPLRSWRRGEVYEYLDARGIPRPATLGRKEQGGLDFHEGSLRELSTREDDWALWLQDFPFSELQIRTDETTSAEDGGAEHEA
jgi:3'-phosphoadenosine 5'-phosphosulfate sulfotransferase (PAPS reductase)/FAD synthetase